MIDPVTGFMALSAAVGAGQALAGAIGNGADRETKARIKKLKGHVGLTDQERARLETGQMERQRAAESAATSQYNRSLAATGQTSGAALQAARRDQAAAAARAGMATHRWVNNLAAEEKARDQNELTNLRAVRAERTNARVGNVIQGLGAVAGAAGDFAAMPPEARSMGLFGAPKMDPEAALRNLPADLPEADRAYVMQLAQGKSPEELAKIVGATSGNRKKNPLYDDRLRAILTSAEQARMVQSIASAAGAVTPAPTQPIPVAPAPAGPSATMLAASDMSGPAAPQLANPGVMATGLQDPRGILLALSPSTPAASRAVIERAVALPRAMAAAKLRAATLGDTESPLYDAVLASALAAAGVVGTGVPRVTRFRNPLLGG